MLDASEGRKDAVEPGCSLKRSRRRPTSGDPDRGPRPLHRSRPEHGLRNRIVAPAVRERITAEQADQDVEAFVYEFGSNSEVRIFTEGGEFLVCL